MGPSSAPRNPPFCIIACLRFKDVFFDTSVRRDDLQRANFFFCAGVNRTLPFNTLRLHSHMQFTKSLLQFFLIQDLRLLSGNLDKYLNIFPCFFNSFDMLNVFYTTEVCTLLASSFILLSGGKHKVKGVDRQRLFHPVRCSFEHVVRLRCLP